MIAISIHDTKIHLYFLFDNEISILDTRLELVLKLEMYKDEKDITM